MKNMNLMLLWLLPCLMASTTLLSAAGDHAEADDLPEIPVAKHQPKLPPKLVVTAEHNAIFDRTKPKALKPTASPKPVTSHEPAAAVPFDGTTATQTDLVELEGSINSLQQQHQSMEEPTLPSVQKNWQDTAKDLIPKLTGKVQGHVKTVQEKFNTFVSKTKETYHYIQAHRLLAQSVAKIKTSEEIFDNPDKFIDKLNYQSPELKNHIAQTNLQDRIELANEIIKAYLNKTWFILNNYLLNKKVSYPEFVKTRATDPASADPFMANNVIAKNNALTISTRVAAFCSLQPSEFTVKEFTELHTMTNEPVPSFPFITLKAATTASAAAAFGDPQIAASRPEIDPTDL